MRKYARLGARYPPAWVCAAAAGRAAHGAGRPV